MPPGEDSDIDRLLAALAWNNEGEVIAWFAGKSERERLAAFPKLSSETNAALSKESGPGPSLELWEAAQAASAPRTKFARHVRYFGSATVQVLLDRQPEWLTEAIAEFLQFSLSKHGWRYPDGAFHGIRELQLAGVVCEIESDGYAISFMCGGGISCVGTFEWRRGEDGLTAEVGWPPHREDPELLEKHIWRIFDVVGRRGLRLLASPEPDNWHKMFDVLVEHDQLDPPKVKAACVRAMSLDRAAKEHGWFAQLYARMRTDTSADEFALVEPDIVALAEASAPRPRTFALLELLAATERGHLTDSSRARDAARGVLSAGDATKVDLKRAKELLEAIAASAGDDAAASAASDIAADLRAKVPPAPPQRRRPLRAPSRRLASLGESLKSDRSQGKNFAPWNLAYALYLVLDRHDDRRARRYIDRAVELASEDPEVLLQAGRFAEFVDGDGEKAERLYRESLENYFPGLAFGDFEPMRMLVIETDGLRPLGPQGPSGLSQAPDDSVYTYWALTALLGRASFNPVEAAEALCALRLRSGRGITVDEIDELIALTRFATVLPQVVSEPQAVGQSTLLQTARRVVEESLSLSALEDLSGWDPWCFGSSTEPPQ